MAAATELHGDPSSGVSPELVLVDAVLSAEARHLLVVPEDTIERLLAGRSGGFCLEEVAPLSEIADEGKTEDGVTDNQALAATSEGDPADAYAAHWPVVLQEATPMEELENLVNDLTSALTMTEHSHPERVEQANNSYPTLPSPSPEGTQQDATETVLRLITGTS